MSNTSFMMEAIYGITMMERTRPAVKRPIPNGAPEKNFPITGREPRPSISHGSTYVWKSGAKTKRPHIP